MLLTRSTDNRSAVLAGALFPPRWIRTDDVDGVPGYGDNYGGVAAHFAALYGENPNSFDGEVLNAIYALGEQEHAAYVALYGKQ